MTSSAFINASANSVSAQGTDAKKEKRKAESPVLMSCHKSEQKSLISSVAELDEKIENLEKESKKSSGSWFGKVYNVFSKKDNKMEEELAQLKEAKKEALKDGNLSQAELANINKEYSEATESVATYKKGKKSAADTASTVAAIGAGVVASVATGGAAAPIVAAALASGGAKVLTKEIMLGDEYEALGKEGLKDGAISAAYGAVGGLAGVAAKAATPAVASGLGKVGVNVSEKVAGSVAKYATKLVADESMMVTLKVANGQEITAGDVLAVGVSSLAFTKAGNHLAKTKLFGIDQNTKELVKAAKITTVASGTYIGKKNISKQISKFTS